MIYALKATYKYCCNVCFCTVLHCICLKYYCSGKGCCQKIEKCGWKVWRTGFNWKVNIWNYCMCISGTCLCTITMQFSVLTLFSHNHSFSLAFIMCVLLTCILKRTIGKRHSRTGSHVEKHVEKSSTTHCNSVIMTYCCILLKSKLFFLVVAILHQLW